MLKTFSLYKKLLTLFRAGHDQGEHRGRQGTGCCWLDRELSGGWDGPGAWKRAGSQLAAWYSGLCPTSRVGVGHC